MNNFMRVIAPYRYEGTWVFDDPEKGLVKEPFVFGADEMVEWIAGQTEGSEKGLLILFSDRPFPGFQKKLTWIREEADGNWYKIDDPEMEGWLCPALLQYFDIPPAEIYVKAEAKK